MRALAALRAPVDGFFLDVTVNDTNPEKRLNRLRLLNGAGRCMRSPTSPRSQGKLLLSDFHGST